MARRMLYCTWGTVLGQNIIVFRMTLTPGGMDGSGWKLRRFSINTTFDSIHLAGFRERPISVPALAPGEWMDSAENLGAFYLYRIRLDELHF